MATDNNKDEERSSQDTKAGSSLGKHFLAMPVWQKAVVVAAALILLLALFLAAAHVYLDNADDGTDVRQSEGFDATPHLDDLFQEPEFVDAEELLRQGEFEAAAQALTDYADGTDGYKRFHALMRAAAAYHFAENSDAALAVYERVLEEDNQDDAPPLHYASIHDRMSVSSLGAGDLEGAIEYKRAYIDSLEALAGQGGRLGQDAEGLLDIARAELDRLIEQRQDSTGEQG